MSHPMQNYPPHNAAPPPPQPPQQSPYPMPPQGQYVQYPPHQQPQPHYYPPQPMPPHPGPYGVQQHPQMYPPHPQAHWGQPHAPPPPHGPPTHPNAHPHSHPQQQMMHHPQQQLGHPPQPSPYYHHPPQPQPQPPPPQHHMVQPNQPPGPPPPGAYSMPPNQYVGHPQYPHAHHPQAPHPHYYSPQPMPPQPSHPAPYGVSQPAQMPYPPHPQAHWGQHAPPPPHPNAHPHPQQQMMHHPQQQLAHPPPPSPYYHHPPQPQPVQPPPQHHMGPMPAQQPPPQQPQPQQPPAPSPNHFHHPSRNHTPQQTPPPNHTPIKVVPQCPTPVTPTSVVSKVEKKDISFPKNSVEATKPATVKKRKFTSKDVTDIEVWRLLMCLKSGLLAESSWAIDVLCILLNDDSTMMHFGLQHMPGLLETVLEHFKCCLNQIYDGIVSDTMLKSTISETPVASKTNDLNNNNTIDGLIVMLTSKKNYTFKSRDGKIVKLNKDGDAPVQTEEQPPTWQDGNGEESHIQVCFEPKNLIESSRRCISLSTILRNLSFIPGNDVEMSRHSGLLLVLGRLLLLKHDEDIVHNGSDSALSEWALLNSLREDTLVIISNISSSLDLSPYNDKINLSFLDGLLHWACSNSSYALDPFPPPSVTVTPQRLALESLAKLSIIEGNVDLLLATPPWSRIEQLFQVLARLLSGNEDQTKREFSLVLLSNLTAADSGIARKVALTGTAIPRLISFLEMSLGDPEIFSTTQDMLRRAALTLKCLSQLVDNHPLFAQYQPRLLNLVMSQKLDMEVVPIIADVIFEISLSD